MTNAVGKKRNAGRSASPTELPKKKKKKEKKGFSPFCGGGGVVRLIQVKDSSVVLIAKTWADEVRLNRTLSKINFDQKWVVRRLNRGGGLAYFGKILLTLMLLIPTGIILIRLSMETLKMHGDS